MAVAHRASAAHNEATPTTTCTITIPAGVQAGDDLYVHVMSRNHASSDPYVTVVDNDSGGNTWDFEGQSSTSRKFTQWHKKATAGTASKTITVDLAKDSICAGVSAYSGGHASAPTQNITPADLVSGTETTPGFTPTHADAFIVFVVGNQDNLAVASQACTNPGALSERYDKVNTAGSNTGIALASLVQTGGPTATGDFTWAQTNGSTRTLAFSIRPAVTAVVPDTPTANAAASITTTGAALSASAFSDGDADAHLNSDWQVDEAAGDFSSNAFESLADATHKTSISATGLAPHTAYKYRVRYRDDSGATDTSEWSTPVSFSTLGTPPDTPTGSNVSQTESSATVASSVFADDDSDAHEGSQWQIDLEDGDFSSPVEDSGEVAAGELEDYVFTGLNPDTVYDWRVRHKDDSGDAVSEWSEWSTPVEVTTDSPPPGSHEGITLPDAILLDFTMGGALAGASQGGSVNNDFYSLKKKRQRIDGCRRR